MKGGGKSGKRLMAGILILLCGCLCSCGRETEDVREVSGDGITELGLWQDWTDASFTTEEGSVDAANPDQETVLVYWASWCPHCRDSRERIVKLSEDLKAQGIGLYVVDKLGGEKETREAAQSFWEEEEGIPLAYDEGAEIYRKKGLHMLPTVIVLNRKGLVTACEEGQIPDESRLESMVAEARTGKSAKLLESVKRNLLTEQGGVRTNYLEGGALPSGGDELSESMGLMLQNAVSAKDRGLYTRLWNRLEVNSFLPGAGGVYPWVVTDKQEVSVNAAVDDFRIYRAMMAAQDIWEGTPDAGNAAQALTDFLLNDGKLVDFHDFSYDQSASTLTLCYADFEAMERLAQNDGRWDTACRSAMELVKGGRISDDFPLYYSRYNYAAGGYEGEELNMAEALVTLLHLSRAGELPADAYQWLADRLEEGVIYAGYSADGRPALEKRYESTAVYALAAMIALEEDDPANASRAFSLMEPMRIYDSTNVLDGLFGGEDGNGIYSFDQCVALEAYFAMERYLSQ